MPEIVEGPSRHAKWHVVGRSDTILVFVHGLLSSSDACWTNQNGTFWPALVAGDTSFDQASIFLADYYSEVDSGEYDLAQCAREIWDQLNGNRHNGRSPIDYSQIVFVAHSMGGVITRRVLEENSQAFASKQIGLVLIASPSGGSEYAKIFGIAAKLLRHRAALGMSPDSRELKDIDYRFRALLQAKSIDIKGVEACEHHGPRVWEKLPFRLPAIVSIESSSKYFGPPKIIKDTDHSSIAKPDRLDHPTHQLLRSFFEANWSQRRPGVPSKKVVTQINTLDVLFGVYRSAASSFCLVRSEDNDFKSRINIKSVWLHGDSGVGKTTLVKRYLDETGCSPLQLSLGHIKNFKEDSLSRELCETVNSTRQDGNLIQSYADLVSCLANDFASSGIVLFLDEVPIDGMSADDEQLLLNSLSALLDSVQKQGATNLHAVVCSIGRPRVELATQKFQEQIDLLRLSSWTSDDLKGLISIIVSALALDRGEFAITSTLIHAAAGSPRFIKEYYRRRLIVGVNMESPLSSLRVVMNTFNLAWNSEYETA